MSDEYQLRKDIDRVYRDIYRLDNDALNIYNIDEINALLQNYYDISQMQDVIESVISETLLDKVYPIGSIYLSINPTSPSVLFGGTWIQIKDRFLLASGELYDSGDVGGSADAVVVEHTHKQNDHSHEAPHSAFVESSQNLGITDKWSVTHTTGSSGFVYSNLSPTLDRSTHTASTTATNQSTGEDGTDKNMPPYIVVYVWKRISDDFDNIILTSTKDILSYSDNDSCVLSAQLMRDGSSAEIGDVSVQFLNGATLLGTAYTDSSGVATFTYNSSNVGVMNITATADDVSSESFLIEDIYKYDGATSDNTSKYSTLNMNSFTHTEDCYTAIRTLNSSGSTNYYSVVYLTDFTLPNNYEISVDFYSTNYGHQNMLNILSEPVTTYSGTNEFGIVCTDVRYGLFNRISGTGTWYTTSGQLTNESWYNFKIIVNGTSVTATITDANDNVIYDNTQTISNASNFHKFTLVNGYKAHTIKFKNLKVKEL